MKLTVLRRAFNKKSLKSLTIKDTTQMVLNKQGKEQFLKLLDKGLQLPVALS